MNPNNIPLPVSRPTRESLSVLGCCAAALVDGAFLPNCGDNLIALPDDDLDDAIRGTLATGAEVAISLRELLDASIEGGFEVLRLSNGTRIQLIPLRCALFQPRVDAESSAS